MTPVKRRAAGFETAKLHAGNVRYITWSTCKRRVKSPYVATAMDTGFSTWSDYGGLDGDEDGEEEAQVY